MSMAGTIEDMRWQIKQQEKEIARLKRFIYDNNLIREFDEEERKRAAERERMNRDVYG
jgi:hypothetical protein|tara:strand:- start:708 stop:881 length:174 start_codon:yes stop_codon:yes gene_type:complete